MVCDNDLDSKVKENSEDITYPKLKVMLNDSLISLFRAGKEEKVHPLFWSEVIKPHLMVLFKVCEKLLELLEQKKKRVLGKG